MNRSAPYYSSLILPALVVGLANLGGLWPLVSVPLLFVVIPVFDALLGRDATQPHTSDRARLTRFDLPLVLWVPALLGSTLWTLHHVAMDLEHGGHAGDESTWMLALHVGGAIFGLGIVNGVGGINVAHELMHRKGRLERGLAEVLLTAVAYPHFSIEHVHGHHRHVATPRDPVSAARGESFYAFYPRAVVGSLVNAWRIESDRCRRKHIGAWSLRNRRLRYPLVLATTLAGLGWWLGPAGPALFLVQAFFAFSLLEVINYIEHYGLRRRPIGGGRYEKVMPHHSWNTSFRLTNWLLFNLQRHSDHHYVASRPYDRLRQHDGAPELPAGYATMLLVALVPPLWFRLMDPRVDAWARRHPGPAQPG